MRYVTNSEVATFRRCRRKWRLGYVERLQLRRDEDDVSAAKTGTLVHLGLEAYYGGGLDSEAALGALRLRNATDLAALSETDESRIKKVRKQGELAVTMLTGYFEWLAETGADAGLTFVGAEERVEVPVEGMDGVALLGKLDARVVREHDGARLFIDHKTVQSIESYVETLERAPQFKHYHLLERLRARTLGINPRLTDGALVNLLRRVGRGPASKPPFYHREEVRHGPEVLRTYWTQVLGEVIRMVDTERRLLAGGDQNELTPPNPTKDCAWDCIFRPVCPMLDDPGLDAAGVMELAYVAGDPLGRYEDEESDES